MGSRKIENQFQKKGTEKDGSDIKEKGNERLTKRERERQKKKTKHNLPLVVLAIIPSCH